MEELDVEESYFDIGEIIALDSHVKCSFDADTPRGTWSFRRSTFLGWNDENLLEAVFANVIPS